ncbi:hypothetical protein FRC07_008430 [Ceratobasidium sp. 392]|nr:hypothetical protein FRC07_008430 [Ceratobasidium sp. 392]
MRFAFASLVAVATATLAIASPLTPRQFRSINPDPSVVHGAQKRSGVSTPAFVWANTNAKRFAAGLPPLAPRTNRRHPQSGPPGHLGTRVQAAPRAQTSPKPPVNQQCNIFTTYANGTAVGFLSREWNVFGEYFTFVPAQGPGALLVRFTYSPDSPSQLDFTAVNAPNTTYPFFGGIVGFASDSDNFSPDSFNYAYLGGTTQTPPGSPAVPPEGGSANSFSDVTGIPVSVKSSLWTYDPATQAITPQWINTDGSAPATFIEFVQGVIILTGGPGPVADTFGTADELKFFCAPPLPSVSAS